MRKERDDVLPSSAAAVPGPVHATQERPDFDVGAAGDCSDPINTSLPVAVWNNGIRAFVRPLRLTPRACDELLLGPAGSQPSSIPGERCRSVCRMQAALVGPVTLPAAVISQSPAAS
jgi:hypothetical protein